MRQWIGGIRVSGVSILPEKTMLFLIDFEWHNSDYKYHIIEDKPRNVSIPDEEDSMIIIMRKEWLSENDPLGIQLNLTGNQAEQKKVLTKKAKTFAFQIRKKRYNKTTTLWTSNHSFKSYMSYSMVFTQHPEDKWKHIISPANRTTINFSLMLRNMPHAIFYWPEKYQGLDV